MTDPIRAALGAVGVLLVGALVLLVAGAGAARAEERTVPGPLRFEGEGETLLELDDGRRFLDTLELRRGGGGTVLVNELATDFYVAGLAEMPTRWPMEALKAQAVAARTYAWYSIENASWDGYDLCATVACQVFRGADAFLGPATGHRWLEAVEATSGQVLVDGDGRPVLARYFSTSGGRTYANEEVFPRDGVHDHLVAINDPFDVVSPMHRWQARFTREEFDAILARGDTLWAATPVEHVERVGEVEDPQASVRVTGRDGTVVEVSARDLRAFLSSIAPRAFPDRFPGLRWDREAPLPATVPSSRYAVEVTDEEVVFHGRGWGHGVGMGQYGAMARAERGATYLEILATYYAGLEPVTSPQLPERVRVGMDLNRERLTIRPDGVVRIVAGGEVVEDRVLGTWTVARDGDGWRLTPPVGHGDPFEVSATELAGTPGARFGAAVVEVEVSTPALLRLEVTDLAGRPVRTEEIGGVDAGRHVVSWWLDDDDGVRVPAETYRVRIAAEDAAGTVGGEAVEVRVERAPTRDAGRAQRGPSSAAAPDPPDQEAPVAGRARTLPLVEGGAVALAVLAVIALVARRRRSGADTSKTSRTRAGGMDEQQPGR